MELPQPDCFIFRPFVPERVSREHESFFVPCRIKASAGLLRSWEFRPTVHGRQTIQGVREVRSEAGEVPMAFNGVIMAARFSKQSIIANWQAEFHPAGEGLGSVRGVDVPIEQVSHFIPKPIRDFEPLAWQLFPEGVETVYVQGMAPQRILAPSIEYPILQSYVDQRLEGCFTFGIDYAREYLETSRGFSKFWINDRELPRRPWVHQKQYKLIDELCSKHPEDQCNTFTHRCLPEEYATNITGGNRTDEHGGALPQSADWTGRKLLTAVVQDYIFGFGSLIQTKSRINTDPNAVDAVPVRVSPEVGFARSWNFQHPIAQLTALGLERVEDGKGRAINGVVTPVLTAEGLAGLDAREVGYTRVAIEAGHLQALGWAKLPSDARVWMYVPNGYDEKKTPGVALNPASFKFPFLQSYIDVCILGCFEYSEAFAIEFIHTTSGWEGPWLNDRELARRPWVHQPEYKKIDELLARIIPAQFGRRMLPEEFRAAMPVHSAEAAPAPAPAPATAPAPALPPPAKRRMTTANHSGHSF